MPPVSVVPPGSQNPPSAQSQRPAAQQPPSSQALADLLKLLSSIPSSSNYQAAEEIFKEVASLRSQLQSKEKELEQVRNEMSKQVTAKQIAINEMFEANEIEKSKRKEATSGIESLNKLLQEGKDAISQKEREISDSEGRYKKLQSAHIQLQSDLKTAQHDIDGLQHKVKEKDVLIDKIKASHSENQKRLKGVEGRANEVEKEKSALNTSLRATKARLDKIEGYATQHSDCDEDSMADTFIDLWQYSTTELYPHLNKDLSERILQDRSVWDSFKRQSNLAVEHHVPLPHSNSPAAKQMRLAIFLAILAREVDKQIFQPTYIVPEDAGIREVLAKLAASDNEKESFCRSILLSINPDAQNTALQSKIQAVIRNVSSCLYGMLPDDQFDQLRASVGKIVERAVDVWHPIQRSLQRYEPDFEPLKWGDDQWSSLEFPEGSSAGSEASPNMLDESLLTVFPRIAVVEKGNRFPLTYVVQLRRSQPQCMAAGREVSNVPTSPVIGRVTSNRSRRKSNASSNAGHANGTLPSKKKSQGL
ncbi:hypothetical protein BDW59DRAFT_181634 [Aspergillus cavernicola]|uniref:MEI5 protein n=1 Tax=Aspergillus cavernicola TaxID=176166 RepID=A0ABR4HVZ4_9EURO